MVFHSVLPALASAALLAQSSAWPASAAEQWQVVGTTAMGTTGDVTFSPDRIAFGNGKALPLAAAGTVRDFEVHGKKVNATLYRVTAPDDPLLLNGNRLCGGRPPQPVTFIAVWKPALIGADVDPRGIAAFSGNARPTMARRPEFLRHVPL
jgi:hypothetical protein